MNSSQAKQIDLPNLLSRLGHESVMVKKGGKEYWYRSPFRNEKEPSFHTSYLGGKWIWNDFGDEGGTVIDFIMRYKGYGTVKEALSFLDTVYGKNGHRTVKNPPQSHPTLFSFHQQGAPQAPISKNKELEFMDSKAITNTAIFSYLSKRGISKELSELYLEEVRYRNCKSGKVFFAFGMKNRSGGYEIRAATDDYPFKSALICRDITIIKGRGVDKGVNVFEGMLDYLSLLTMMKVDGLSGDSIIMHSLSSYVGTLATIEKAGYGRVNTFLDNDNPGEKTTVDFRNALGADKVHSQSLLFAPHKDLNEALKANDYPDFYG